MKKTYINPETNVVQLNFTQQILSGAIGINSTDAPIDAGNAASRGSVDFDDEFFDE